MMSLTFGLFTQVSGSGPLGPLVMTWLLPGNNGEFYKGKLQGSRSPKFGAEIRPPYM